MGMIVSIDGVMVSPDQAVVSVFDRGFLYGDSVYEVIRTYGGVPFELEAHLTRLYGSAARIAMTVPFPREQLAEEVTATHRASGNVDSYLRVMVTRGSGPIGLDIALARSPRRVMIAQDVRDVVPPRTAYEDGVEIALVSVRRNLRTALDPQAKTGNYLNSVMALAEARGRGAFEAVMLDHNDVVTEGASSNIFLVLGGSLYTPPVEVGILVGVTRTVVLRVARRSGIDVREEPLSAETIHEAEEAFITSSIREVVPVVRVDGRSIGSGRPGTVTSRLRELFDGYVAEYVSAHQ